MDLFKFKSEIYSTESSRNDLKFNYMNTNIKIYMCYYTIILFKYYALYNEFILVLNI